MPVEIVRKPTPEQEELDRKRAELALVRALLAERELDLADLRAELKSFEGRYLREVGVLYAELDEWEAKIADLEAKLNPSQRAEQCAQDARNRADESHEAAHGEASKSKDFNPSPALKNLFREAARRIHPDFAKDDADRERRTRLMAQANDAYDRGDGDALQRILDDFDESGETIQGEGIGAELIRIIRQIHHAKKNIDAIDCELVTLHTSATYQLMQGSEHAKQDGRDLLAEIATALHRKIDDARGRCRKLRTERRKQ